MIEDRSKPNPDYQTPPPDSPEWFAYAVQRDGTVLKTRIQAMPPPEEVIVRNYGPGQPWPKPVKWKTKKP